MMPALLLLRVVQDSTSGAAYVARPGGPPDTSAYMWAGYVVALTVYLGYVALMARRIKQSRRRMEQLSAAKLHG